MKKSGFLIPLFLLFHLTITPAYSQIDREFWLAVPYVTPLHANRPVYLRISTFQKPAQVRVTLPGVPTAPPLAELTIPANDTYTIDLSARLTAIQCMHNDVTNTGVKITASTDVTAYYEVFGSSAFASGVNTDLFALKGKNALGTEFYIPFQNHWDNYPLVDGWSSFDIVATEDNTSITITPTQDLLGHSAGVPFTIILHKGYTYSARSLSNLGSLRPTGSHVTSNKPIAITMKDDSIIEGVNYDLAGDQLVPVTVIGKEYIALKASGNYNLDRVFICATEDATDIFLKGNSVAVTTINTGQTYAYQLDDSALYISTSKNAYVFHVSGYGRELAGALLPSIVCGGSKQISFTRSNYESFSLNVIVKDGGEDDFILNGNTTIISPDSFRVVPGNPGWKYAQMEFTEVTIASGATSTIINTTTSFHLGTINGQPDNTGFRYGYFSDYGTIELGENVSVCAGDSAVMDAGFGKDSYLWWPGNETTQTIVAKDSGWYKVTVTKDICTYEDSLKLLFYPSVEDSLVGPDTTACRDVEFINLTAVGGYDKYSWSTGDKTRKTKAYRSGEYIVKAYNEYGCFNRDTIAVTFMPLPKPVIKSLAPLDTFCWDTQITLEANSGFMSYEWYNGETGTSITVPRTSDDRYSLEVTGANGCTNSTVFEADCSPFIGLIPNLITPNADGYNEVFYISNLKPEKWSLEIYNQWGDCIYKNTAYHNNFSGETFSDGIYYYRLKHTTYDIEYKGWLQILH